MLRVDFNLSKWGVHKDGERQKNRGRICDYGFQMHIGLSKRDGVSETLPDMTWERRRAGAVERKGSLSPARTGGKGELG